MAKLKAPLLSLGASGALGKSLVFFGWKGLDVVREYVIPSNPRSTDQLTQRGYFTNAVAEVHEAEAETTFPLVEADMVAYALYGSCYPTPRTWFNQAIKNYIDQKVLGKEGTMFRGGSVAEGVDTLTPIIYSNEIAAACITAGNFHYGSSKTALVNIVAATIDLVAHSATIAITPLTTGVKYYIQFRPSAVAVYIGIRSGIYTGTPT